ncbi:hypothetical protein R4Z09_12150 [Niallia oryzisoli]|uniref:Uncharacterized protein n=1 Tax=Niallia oryzisoli TaxID=1737571 RepID=A0ABZ2CIT9_9BACI
MKLLEAYEAKRDLIHKERELIRQEKVIMDKIIAELIKSNKAIKNESSEIQFEKESELPKKQQIQKGQISSIDLAEIIKPVLVTNQKMTAKELEAYLRDNFGFTWKAFDATMRSLRTKGYLKFKKENNYYILE